MRDLRKSGLSLDELKRRENEELGFGDGVPGDADKSFSKDLNESHAHIFGTGAKAKEQSVDKQDPGNEDPKAVEQGDAKV